MNDLPIDSILEQQYGSYKGYFAENYVAQEWIATGHKELYYWTSEGTAEIDFLIEQENAIYPLEVKAGVNQKKKSLLVYNQKYAPSKLVRASAMNLKHNGDIYNYPLYLISRFPLTDLTNHPSRI